VQAELDGASLAQRVLGAVSSALRDADCRLRIRQDGLTLRNCRSEIG